MSRTQGGSRKASSVYAVTATSSAEAPERTLAPKDETSLNASRGQLLRAYPHIPNGSVNRLLDFASKDGEGFVGRSGILDSEWKTHSAVTAYIRCSFTNYEALLSSLKDTQSRAVRAVSRRLARNAVSEIVERIANNWRNGPGSNISALSTNISEECAEEGNIPDTANERGCGVLPYSPPPPGPEAQSLQNNKIRLPTLEEVQITARSKKPQPSSSHSKVVKKAHGSRLRLSERKAPFYSGRHAEKLELAFARMDLTSIVRTNVSVVDIDRTKFEAPSDTQMASLVAETAALGLQDTFVDHKDAQLLRVHSSQELFSDATISDLEVNHYEALATSPGLRLRLRKPKQPRKNRLHDIRAAEMSLRDLTQNPHPKAHKIARASERVKKLQRASLRKDRKDRKQERAALKATMRRI